MPRISSLSVIRLTLPVTSETPQFPQASCLKVALLDSPATGCDCRIRMTPTLGTYTLEITTRWGMRNLAWSRFRLLLNVGKRARL
jgi:hypothetical protein